MRILLAHGAWAGPWIWDALIAGWDGRHGLEAVDLRTAPDDTDADLVDRLVAEIGADTDSVLLVAHSGAAALALSAAERCAGQVRGLVSIAGLVLPPGVDLATVAAEIGLDARFGIGAFLETTPGGTVVPPAAAASVFFHDLEPRQAVDAAARLVPQASGALTHSPTWTTEATGRIPHLYVEATRDRSVPLELQRHLQHRAGLGEIATIACGHVPQAVHPDRVRQLIKEFDRRLEAVHTLKETLRA